MAQTKRVWSYYTAGPDEDAKPTDELPVVHLNEEIMPPSWPHPARFHEHYVHGGDAQQTIESDPRLTVAYYDPRDSIMIVDSETHACHTTEIGTRATPLDRFEGEPGGAMRRMVESRRHGISAAIGKKYLIESDEIPQGECTALARGW